ncbi:MAG: laminin sub domain 2, partial [Thermoleophilia bacterium]|nr:laminin sub domain 2 [Thermoleophilia bacterium]
MRRPAIELLDPQHLELEHLPGPAAMHRGGRVLSFLLPILLIVALLVGGLVLAMVRTGDEPGNAMTTFLQQARPLPRFVMEPLGGPVAGRAEFDDTLFSGELDQPFVGGFVDDRTQMSGFTRIDDTAVLERRDFQRGVRFTTAEYDVVQDRATNAVREQTVVHAHQGTHTWRWRIVNGTAAHLDADGRIIMANGTRIDSPIVFTATGRKLEIPGLGWRLRGDEFSLTFDDSKLALPYVIDPDNISPTIGISNITTSTPGCVYVSSASTAYIRTKNCAGDVTVAAMAFDTWQDYTDTPSFTGGLKTVNSDTATNYGVLFPPITGTPQTNGTTNFPTTAIPLAGYQKGLNMTCYPNALFGGTGVTGIDTKLDYDAQTRGVAQGFRNMDTTISPLGPAGRTGAAQAPRIAQPGSGDLSCEWRGYLTPRAATGTYAFKAYSDDHMRVDVLPQGASYPTYNDCTGGTAVACDWSLHGPSFGGTQGGTVNILNTWEARPFRVIWDDRGGQAATAVLWDPPGAPNLYPNNTAAGNVAGQANYEVIPSTNYVTGVDYTRTYSWAADPADPTGTYSYSVTARDTVNRTATASFTLSLDNDEPDVGTFSAVTVPDWQANSTWTNDNTILITKKDNTDAQSGVDPTTGGPGYKLERAYAPFNSVTHTCGAAQPLQNITPVANAAASPTTWTFNTGSNQTFTDTVADGCYFYQYTRTDRVGNMAISLMSGGADVNDTSTWMKVDTTKPIYSPASLSFTPQAGSSAYQYVDPATPSTLFYNPNFPGSVQISLSATDGGRGVDRVVFPDPDGATTGWPNGVVTDGTDVKTTPYAGLFNWNTGATSTGAFNAAIYDLVLPASNQNGPTNVPYTITADGSAPTGGTITMRRQLAASACPGTPPDLVTNDYFGDAVCLLLNGTPVDNAGGSGLDNSQATWQRAEAPLTNNVCGSFTLFADITGVNPGTSFKDTNTIDGMCYQYQYHVPDHVGNYANFTNGVTIKKDTTKPTGGINALTENPGSGAVLITGFASDAGSGLNYVSVTYSGPSSGNWCPAAPPGPALPGGNWSCNTSTAGFPDGTYTITLTVYDRAGNLSVPYTTTLVLDNAPPVASFANYAPVSGAQYQYAVGNTLYFNPGFGGSVDITINADDGLGTGMNRVDFPAIAAGWSAATSDSATPFVGSFTWAAGASAPGGPLNASAVDNAGSSSLVPYTIQSDAAAPSGGSVAYTNGSTNAANISISYAAGTDGAGSGIGYVMIQRAETTLTTGTCGTFSAFGDVSPTNPASPWSDTTAVSGNCYMYQAVVRDRVSNEIIYTSSNVVKVDRVVPTGTIGGTASPFGGPVTISGTSNDGQSGIQKVDVTYSGAASGSICSGQPASWSCTWSTGGVVVDGTYTLSAKIYDNAGNTTTVTRTVVVDNTPPVVTFTNFAAATNPGSQFQDPVLTATHWYNPAAAGSFDVNLNATDAGVGMNRVVYPAFPAGWTNVGLTDNSAPFATSTYTFAVGATEPGTVTATAFDDAGKSSTINFTVLRDTADPTGASITLSNTTTGASSIPMTFNKGSDSQSGLATWRIERHSATLTNGTCGAYGAYTPISIVNPTSPWTDSTITNGNCYQYQITTTDNVGRTASFPNASEIRVDTGRPSGTIAGTPASPFSGTVTINGTATDGNSGVQNARLERDNGAIVALCASATLTIPPPTGSTTWNCPWDTTTVADGTYTLRLIVTDAATNVNDPAAPIESIVTVDNTPPVVGIPSWTPQTGLQYQYVSGSNLFVNPAQSGSSMLTVVATDAGVGVNHVDFPDPDGAASIWTPLGVTADSSSPYTNVYGWSTGAANPGTLSLTAYDNAGKSATNTFSITNDSTPPAGGSISYANAVVTPSSVSISFSGGSDGGSGILSRQLQRDTGTYSAGTCSAYTGTFTNIVPVNPTSPYADATGITGKCYKYQLVETDRVSNQTIYTSGSEVKIDGTIPTGTIALTPVSPWGGTVSVTGTASDTMSGVNNVNVKFSGPANGTICSSPALTALPDPRNWTCSWNTAAGGIPDGTYTITLEVFDVAGNSALSADTRSVVVDNNPPSLVFANYTTGSGSTFQYATGSTMFYNPLQAGSFTVNFTATDGGVGVNRVDFPTLG